MNGNGGENRVQRAWNGTLTPDRIAVQTFVIGHKEYILYVCNIHVRGFPINGEPNKYQKLWPNGRITRIYYSAANESIQTRGGYVEECQQSHSGSIHLPWNKAQWLCYEGEEHRVESRILCSFILLTMITNYTHNEPHDDVTMKKKFCLQSGGVGTS